MRIGLLVLVGLVLLSLSTAWAEEAPSTPALHEGKPAAQLLAQALEDEDAYVRDTSDKALIGLGQHARPALEALLKTDSGLDKDLAEAIGEALKRIRGS